MSSNYRSILNVQGSSFASTNSFTFDGSSDYIDCGNDSSLNFSADDAFSFSVWFKKGSDSGSNTVFSKGLGAINYDGYYMFALADYVYEKRIIPR